MIRKSAFLLGLLLIALGGGCAHRAAPVPPGANRQSMQDQVDKVNASPNLSPAQKQNIVALIQRSQRPPSQAPGRP